LGGSAGFLRIFSFDNSSGVFNVLLEDFSALIWGFPLDERCWPSLVSLSVVQTTVGLDSSIDTYVILLVFGHSLVFILRSFNVSIASGFPSLLLGDNSLNLFSGSGLLLVGVLWVLLWWLLFAFLLLFWCSGSVFWSGGWISLGKRGFTSESWKLIFDWHWGVVNESAISLNFSSDSNSVFLVF